MKKLILGFALLLVINCAANAGADSLWHPAAESAFADHKAHRVGDVLTVLIVESSIAKHTAKTASSKELELEAAAGTGIFKYIKPFSLSGKRSSSGTGNSEQTTSLIDRVSVKVIEVLPNGAMRVQGEREVSINADRAKLALSGLVRKEDVTSENTVYSSQVAELNICDAGKGPTADTQKPGLIYKILRWLW